MLGGHGGNIYEIARLLDCAPSDIVDMSNNINPLGPPPSMLDFIKNSIEAITRLPEVDSMETIRCFAARYALDPECVLAGNGTTQFIYMIPKVLETKRVLILGPTYADYSDACSMHGVRPAILTAEESDYFRPNVRRLKQRSDGSDTVFICNPNNPTGALISKHELEWLCRSQPDTNFIIDESYLPFAITGEQESMMNSGLPNVIVLISISKIFKIPGLRIGFLNACTDTIKKFRRYMLPWSVNSLAQAVGQYLTAYESELYEFIEKTKLFFEDQRKNFYKRFEHTPEIKLFPSTTPFVLMKLPASLCAGDVRTQLAQDKILIRDCSNFYGLSDQFIRISLKTQATNQMLVEKLLLLIQRAKIQSQNSDIRIFAGG